MKNKKNIIFVEANYAKASCVICTKSAAVEIV